MGTHNKRNNGCAQVKSSLVSLSFSISRVSLGGTPSPYNENICSCISSSHLHWEASSGMTETFFSVLVEWPSATGSKQNPNKSPQGRPPSPHHSHTHLKVPALEKHCLVIGQKLHSPTDPERCWDNRGVRAFTTQVPAEETRKGWVFLTPPSLAQKKCCCILSPDHGSDELEGTE